MWGCASRAVVASWTSSHVLQELVDLFGAVLSELTAFLGDVLLSAVTAARRVQTEHGGDALLSQGRLLVDDGLPDVRVICRGTVPLMAMARFPTNKAGNQNPPSSGI